MTGHSESPIEFLKRAGIAFKKLGSKEVRFKCPECGKSEGFSMNLKTGQWGCLRASCGKKGNLHTLKGLLGFAYEIGDFTGESRKEELEWSKAFEPSHGSEAELWASYLWSSKLADPSRVYLRNRGISDRVSKLAKLGWIPRNPGDKRTGKVVGQGLISIPYFGPASKSEPVMVKLRTVPPESAGSIRYSQIKGGTQILYAPIGLRKDKTALVVGGEIDCLSVVQSAIDWELDKGDWEACGICPFSVPSGEGNWKDTFSKQLEEFEEVVVCFDNDEAGEIGASKAVESIGVYRCKVGHWPEGYKDGNEAYQAGSLDWTAVETIVRNAESVGQKKIVSILDLKADILDSIFRENPKGWPTGWNCLDEAIGGWRPGEVTLVTGQSGAGKTTFVLDAAYRQAATGKKIMVCAIEGGPTFAAVKLIRRHVGKDPYKAGKESCVQAIEEFGQSFVMFRHVGAVDSAKFRETLDYCVRGLCCNCIVVDHLHFMTKRDSRKRWDIQDQIIMDCQTIISTSQSHMWLLAHSNAPKQYTNRDDYTVQLSDIKGHTEAFQDVANVLSVYRPRSNDREDLRDELGLYPAAVVSLKQRMEYGREALIEMKLDKEKAMYLDPEEGIPL